MLHSQRKVQKRLNGLAFSCAAWAEDVGKLGATTAFTLKKLIGFR